jgi:hypothetical protein
MNRHLSCIAAVLLLIAAAVVIVRRSGTSLAGAPAHEAGSAGARASQSWDDGQDDKPGLRTRPRRQTLEECLPPGSKVARSSGKGTGLTVTFPDGSSVTAAGASLSERGVSYRGPYKFEGSGTLMNSMEKDSCLFFSHDGKSMKAIGKTSLSNASPHGGGDISMLTADEGLTIKLPDSWKERGR